MTDDGTKKDDSDKNDASALLLPLSLSLVDGAPPFYSKLHQDYIVGLAAKMDKSYEGALTEHLRMSGVYWSLTALSLLLPWNDVDRLMGVTTSASSSSSGSGSGSSSADGKSILDWLFTCYDVKTGGFGGNSGQDGHILYTLSAIQILALANALDDARLEKEKVITFILKLQQPDGSWAGDPWGEIDTRFTYCALSALSQLQALEEDDHQRRGHLGTSNVVAKAVDYLLQCRNLDGGFGSVIGAESHAGQVFCCIGALSIAKSLDRLGPDGVDLLAWWLAERQVDSGGLNGRPEKQADVCYSWWILSALSILGKVSWINKDKLATFILKCQDDQDGGIADRPDDMADVFHTFFGIGGLSLMGHLHGDGPIVAAAAAGQQVVPFRQIDPIYALPTDVCQRLKLPGQVVAPEEGEDCNVAVDSRLAGYDSCRLEY